MKKNILLFLSLLISSFCFSQKYYPKLNNLWFDDKDGIINSTDYGPLVTEVKRISEKIFYGGFQFSVNGDSGFYSLHIVPKKDSIENIFKSNITIIFDKEYNKKSDGIPMTYTQSIDKQNKKLTSRLVVDKGGFNLLIPEKLFRDSASKKSRLMFNITEAEIKAEKGVTQIELIGTFPEEIKFKKSSTQEITKIILEYSQNKAVMKVPYVDRKNNIQYRILFEQLF